MRALLLAAGCGMRLRPLTLDIPKCLVDINGIPLLEYWLHSLSTAGIDKILINLHYKAERVIDFVNNSDYNHLVTFVFEETLLGTGGTLLKNSDFFSGDSIMLIHADNLSLFNVNEFILRHQGRPSNVDITMMTFTTSTPETCGIVELNEYGLVKKFCEKPLNPSGNLANAAIFILEPKILEFLKNFKKEEIDFSAEVIPHFVGKIYSFHNEIYHRDIGNIESLEMARKEFPFIYDKFAKEQTLKQFKF